MSNSIGAVPTFPRKRAQQGSTLILALLVMVALLILTGGYVATIISEHGQTARSYDLIVALNLAEAGVEETIWELNYGGADFLVSEGWSGTDPKTKSVTLQSAAGDTLGDYFITASGVTGVNPKIEVTGFVPNQSSPRMQKTVVVRLESSFMPNMAVFGTQGVDLDSNASTDSYDSRLGDYGGVNVGFQGDIGTNAISTDPPAIALDSNVVVKGDIAVGPGGDPLTAIAKDTHVTVTGDETAAASAVTLPSVVAPAGLPFQGSINLGSNDSQVISGSGEYSSIMLDSNSTLTIDSDVTIYITGGLELDSNSELIITNGADVQIYVDGWVYIDSNTEVNNLSKDPTKLTILGTDNLIDQGSESGIELESNNPFYGSIYSPKASIEVDSNVQIFGAITANYVSLDSNVRVHYDLALQTAGPYLGSGSTIASWQEY